MYFTKCFSRPQPGLLCTHGLEGVLSSRVPERGIPRRGEQCPVVEFSYEGYSPPKMHMQWHITTSTLHTINNTHMELFVSCMKCFHANTPSHSPTPSYMPMPGVANFIGNTNDTYIPSLCRLTNTQCNLPMGSQSQVNPDSYHSTLGLSDNTTVCFLLGNITFWFTPRVYYNHTELFG